MVNHIRHLILDVIFRCVGKNASVLQCNGLCGFFCGIDCILLTVDTQGSINTANQDRAARLSGISAGGDITASAIDMRSGKGSIHMGDFINLLGDQTVVYGIAQNVFTGIADTRFHIVDSYNGAVFFFNKGYQGETIQSKCHCVSRNAGGNLFGFDILRADGGGLGGGGRLLSRLVGQRQMHHIKGRGGRLTGFLFLLNKSRCPFSEGELNRHCALGRLAFCYLSVCCFSQKGNIV